MPYGIQARLKSSTMRHLASLSFSYCGTQAKYLARQTDFWSWYESTDLFWVLSLGRSGTKFLSGLLDHASDADVRHEPVWHDSIGCQLAYWGIAEKSYASYRIKESFFRIQNQKSSHGSYGEANSLLRRHAGVLSKYHPEVKLLHLVRDGRDVVRSIMSRSTFRSRDDINTRYISPKPNDTLYEKWSSMTRFEKCCWYWKEENAYLRRHINQRVRFEDMLTSYRLFREQILEPLGLEVSQRVWTEHVKRPTNSTSQYQIGEWSSWPQEQKIQFLSICGEEMQQYGYLVDGKMS